MDEIDVAVEEQTEQDAPTATCAPERLNADQSLAFTIVSEICAATGLDVRPEVRRTQPPYMDIDLAGPDAALTFGRYGPSLDALQMIANLIISRRTRTDVRLLIDAAGYRGRRADILRTRAIELAREVKARNQEAELEPLPAHERRIIHSVLADDPEVETYSEGDDPDRRVVISPRAPAAP
jgi:spoIIIJ-associated protein